MSITYHFARGFEGRPIMAHCKDGRRYYGVVTRVTPDAIHLRPLPYGYGVSHQFKDEKITTAENTEDTLEILETSPGAYGGYGGRGFGGRGFGGWWWGAGWVLPLYVLLAISLFWW